MMMRGNIHAALLLAALLSALCSTSEAAACPCDCRGIMYVCVCAFQWYSKMIVYVRQRLH